MRVSLRLYSAAAASARSHSIGWIGLGAMGREMAANLVRKTGAARAKGAPKPRIVVHDHFERATTAFLADHSASQDHCEVVTASSPGGVAKLCSTVFTMLPSSPQVQEVYLEEMGILQAIADRRDEPTLCVDCTTLDQAVAKEVATAIRDAGGDMLDAPVSGGTVGANAGTLSFMVGGSDEAFKRAEPLLLMMGRRAIHCGQSGNGLAAKIANNLLLGISMLGAAEAMLLGTKLGLKPDLLADIINTSTGKCWASEINNPMAGSLRTSTVPADRGYSGGFLSKLMAKDLRLAMHAADDQSIKLPATTLTSRVYEKLEGREEYADLDFSVVLRWLEESNAGLKE